MNCSRGGIVRTGMAGSMDRDQRLWGMQQRLAALAAEVEVVAGRFGASQGLHATDTRALRVLAGAQTPMTAGELGERLDVTKSAATRTVDRLERSGHVERVPDPGDRRRVLLRLTTRAEEAAAEFFGRMAVPMRAATRDFTDKDLDAVERFLSLTLEVVRTGR